MKRRNFIAAIGACGIVAACARNEKRSPRYDAHQCPFCSPKPGVCSYCNGTHKCSFCDGTGTRTTVVPAEIEPGIKKASYKEPCQYCKGNGVCRYCGGNGRCWACDGTGKIKDWDFFEKYKKGQGAAAIVDSSGKK